MAELYQQATTMSSLQNKLSSRLHVAQLTYNITEQKKRIKRLSYLQNAAE